MKTVAIHKRFGGKGRSIICGTATLLLIALLAINISCKKERTGNEITVAFSGMTNFVKGNVTMEWAGTVNPLKVGDSVPEGSKIVTAGEKSFAEIYIGENAIKVMGNTTLVIAKTVMSSDGKVTDLTVEKGSVFSKIPEKLEKGDGFNVRTSHAVAAVRGTEFMVSDDGTKSNIACVDGKVEVSQLNDSAKSVVLEEKEEVDVDSEADMVKKQIDDDKLRILKIETNISELRQDIRKKYEDQRNEMRKRFEDEREAMRKAVTDQKDKDKANIADQKKRDAENIDAVKSGTKEQMDSAKSGASDSAKDSTDKAKEGMDSAKAGTQDAKSSAKSAVEEMKNKNKTSGQ